MINRDTQLCMSLAGRPGNFGTRFHNYLYEKLGLNYIYKAFTTQDIAAAVKGVRALGRLKRAAYHFSTLLILRRRRLIRSTPSSTTTAG